jgi:predicted metal-binding membrane protein
MSWGRFISGFGNVDCSWALMAINMLSAAAAPMLLYFGSRRHKVPPRASARSYVADVGPGLANHGIGPA